MTLRLATGPVAWGVDFANRPGNPDWTEVLDGIAAAGYSATELGPFGFLPHDRAALGDRRLALSGGFIFEPLHDPRETGRIVALARHVASVVGELGGDYLLIIDSVDPLRAATAGSAENASRLDDAARDAMGESVAAVAAIAEDCGVVPMLHPHAGTYVEFADEIEPLRSICGLCVDTGHFSYAGIDPARYVADNPEAVGCIHLKDVDPRRLRPDFWDSVASGAFVPLGRGTVDLGGLLATIESIGYQGWMVVEQDRVPGSGDPVGDLKASRRYLTELAA